MMDPLNTINTVTINTKNYDDNLFRATNISVDSFENTESRHYWTSNVSPIGLYIQ